MDDLTRKEDARAFVAQARQCFDRGLTEQAVGRLLHSLEALLGVDEEPRVPSAAEANSTPEGLLERGAGPDWACGGCGWVNYDWRTRCRNCNEGRNPRFAEDAPGP